MLATEASTSNRVTIATLAVLLAGYLTCLIVNWPGHLEFDSVRQLLEGRRGVYSNWHPPIMSFLLGVTDAILPGGALFAAMNTTLAFAAIASLVLLSQRPNRLSPLLAAACVALPQLFLFQAIVWKDILFGDLMLLGFALIGLVALTPHPGRLRTLLKIAAHPAFALAILSRQNGIVVLPCAAAAWGLIEARVSHWRTAWVGAAVFSVLTGLLAYSMNAGLQLRASKALGPREQFEDLQLYDIAGLLQRKPALALPVLEARAPGLAALLRQHGARLYTADGQDRLIDYPPLRRFIIPSTAPVNDQWKALVSSNPGDYLTVRAHDFRRLLFGGDPDACSVFEIGVKGNPQDLKAAKLSPRYDRRDRWLYERYAAPLLGTPIFSHAFYALFGLVCFAFLASRRRTGDAAIACMLAAAALYAASYFFISISCEYRYLFPLDLAVIAAAFYVGIGLRKNAEE